MPLQIMGDLVPQHECQLSLVLGPQQQARPNDDHAVWRGHRIAVRIVHDIETQRGALLACELANNFVDVSVQGFVRNQGRRYFDLVLDLIHDGPKSTFGGIKRRPIARRRRYVELARGMHGNGRARDQCGGQRRGCAPNKIHMGRSLRSSSTVPVDVFSSRKSPEPFNNRLYQTTLPVLRSTSEAKPICRPLAGMIPTPSAAPAMTVKTSSAFRAALE